MLVLPIEIIAVKEDNNFYKASNRSVGEVWSLAYDFSTIEVCTKLQKSIYCFKIACMNLKNRFQDLKSRLNYKTKYPNEDELSSVKSFFDTLLLMLKPCHIF